MGDSVVFTYSSSHDVYEFSDKAAFDACDFSSATLLGGTRDSPYTLEVTGTHYIGCSKGSYCRNGQKVAINGAKSKAVSNVDWKVTSYDGVTAAAGDSVVFTYSSSHDVYEFSDKAAFDACDFGSATLLGGTRDSPYTLEVTGTHYIGCSKGSHCRNGQKVAINGAKSLIKASYSVDWKVADYDDISATSGDTVSFSYSSSHDVYEFNDKAAYDACDFSSATLIGGTRDSPVDFAVTGTAYLGCSKGSHCRNGQKIAINV